VLSEHKAIRVVPEDEAVIIEEARRLLNVPKGFVEDAVAFGVFKRADSSMVRLDSVLKYVTRARHVIHLMISSTN